MQRCFLSLRFTPEQQQQLYHLGQQAQSGQGQWHSAGNLHLTLVFLGLQDDNSQRHVWQACLQLCRNLGSPFLLNFDRFASFHQANVFYLGLSQPPQELMVFQQKLQQLLLPFVHTPMPERFVPHVTLARKFQSADTFPLAVQPLRLLCTEVALYHSVSTEQGVNYKPVHTYTLVPKD